MTKNHLQRIPPAHARVWALSKLADMGRKDLLKKQKQNVMIVLWIS